MKTLTGHHTNPSNDFVCKAELMDRGNEVEVRFEVQNYIAHTSESFSGDYSQNIGLWDFDVCEAFLTFADDKYLELQSSPLNQGFSYMIVKPRQEFFTPKLNKLELENKVLNNTWYSSIKILKENIPGSGDLMGNLFVCLGSKDERCYFALNINKDETPDFHQRKLFTRLA